MDRKPCRDCKEVKVLTDFPLNKQTKDGRGSYCSACHTIRTGQNQAARRLQALAALGNKCKRCGIDDVRLLVIDHPKGGGRADRKAIGGPRVFYKFVTDHPEKYQALCHNCNHLKRLERKEHRKPQVH